MDAAKVRLSSAEMALVMDPSWILTKNSIMGKAVALMAALSGLYKEEWDRAGGILRDGRTAGSAGVVLPAGGNGGIEPKISKGENYKGLPYVMLDYPRIFGRDDVFAIRTMFWWGHAFSVTCHIKGVYKDLLMPVIRQRLELLEAAGFHVAIDKDEWRHELWPDNYRPLGGSVETDLPFLKLAAACSLEKWEDMTILLPELFRTLLNVLR